jgi:hypothetical protein
MGSIIQPVNASNIARRIEVTTQARAEEAVTHVLELTQLTLLCQVACGDIEIAIVHSVQNSCCNIGHVYGYQRGVLKTRRLTVKTTPKSHSISLEVSARYPRGSGIIVRPAVVKRPAWLVHGVVKPFQSYDMMTSCRSASRSNQGLTGARLSTLLKLGFCSISTTCRVTSGCACRASCLNG